MPADTSWGEYYELTRNQPPSELLTQALEHASHRGKAIDIGGGALKDSRYLLEEGFEVTVLDGDPLVEKIAEDIASPTFRVFISSFDMFDFGEGIYDIASAMFSLPFNPPDTFDVVFARIKRSLVKDGIFCGQFFGLRDGWSINPDMTFHGKGDVERLLADMEIISLTEKEKDGKTANGTPKHWHVFHVIARKK